MTKSLLSLIISIPGIGESDWKTVFQRRRQKKGNGKGTAA